MAFGPDEIKKAVAEKLATDITIPDNHKVALVTFINNDKAEVAIATKVNDNWSVDLLGSHSWTGENKIGFISKMTW